jgi:hypothetical protein
LASASEFLRVLQHDTSLSTAHRPWRLRLAHSEQLSGAVLLAQSTCFHGAGSVRDVCAGECFSLTGHPEIDSQPVAEPLSQEALTALWEQVLSGIRVRPTSPARANQPCIRMASDS